MGWFSSKKDDVVDLTMLQRKGLLKTRSNVKDEEGFVNLGTNNNSNEGSSSNSDVGTSALGFLGNLANVGKSESSSSSGINPTPSTSINSSSGGYLSNLKAARKSKFAEFQHMKVKIEDIEYKVDRFIDKLDAIEDRLRDLERRGNSY